MLNVIAGPWTTPPARKRWARMTRPERAAFRAWENWLVRDVLCALSRRGRERSGAAFGQAGNFGILQDAEFLGREGLKATSMDARLKAPPPLPSVWPEDFNLDIARAALVNLEGSSSSGGVAATAPEHVSLRTYAARLIAGADAHSSTA